jgi:hypothetical protein
MTTPDNSDPAFCQICGKPAERGFLLSAGRAYSVAWYPGEPTWWNRVKAQFSEAPVRMSETGGFFDTWVKAIYCKSCERVILAVTPKNKYYPHLKE